MTPHLPPPPLWRAAQARARVCGLRLDMTADGVFRFYRLRDGQEHNRRDDWPATLALLAQMEARRMDVLQMEMAL